MILNIDLSRITDTATRRAIKDIQDTLNNIDLISARYKMLDITYNQNQRLEVVHNLGFLPTDIIVTRSTGAGYSFVWEAFTDKILVINTLGAGNIRLYVGRNNGVSPIGTN